MKYFYVSTKICIKTLLLRIYKQMYLGKATIFIALPDTQ